MNTLMERVGHNNAMIIRDEVINHRRIQRQIDELVERYPKLCDEFVTDNITEQCPRFAYYRITLKHKIGVPKSDYDAYMEACAHEFEKLGHSPKPIFKNEDAIFKRLTTYKDNLIVLSRELETAQEQRAQLLADLDRSRLALSHLYDVFLKYAATVGIDNMNIIYIRVILYRKAMTDDKPYVYRECTETAGDQYVKKTREKIMVNIKTGNISDPHDDYQFPPYYIDLSGDAETLTANNDMLIEIDKYELA